MIIMIIELSRISNLNIIITLLMMIIGCTCEVLARNAFKTSPGCPGLVWVALLV